MRIDYDNGYYIGDVDSNDERHGFGTYYWNDGDKYEGNWIHGERTGKGTYYYSDGDKYVGDFVDGYFHGKGTYYWTDGDRYEGDWLNGKRTGKGTYYFSNGNKYEGDWQDDNNATNVIYTYGSNFDRGEIVNGEFVAEVQQWSTKNSSYAAAIHPNNNTVEHGSYHNNDKSNRGALSHIHRQDGSEILLEEYGDKLKVTYKKDGISRVEYIPKKYTESEYNALTKKLFDK